MVGKGNRIISPQRVQIQPSRVTDRVSANESSQLWIKESVTSEIESCISSFIIDRQTSPVCLGALNRTCPGAGHMIAPFVVLVGLHDILAGVDDVGD